MTGRVESPLIDPRDTNAFVTELIARLPGYLPELRAGATNADVAMRQVVARYLAAITARLNRVPERQQLALLDLLGIRLSGARPARAVVVFSLAPDAADARVPDGTRIVAQPAGPPVATDAGAGAAPTPITFEVERATGLAAARLAEVRSLWPSRDQSIDHRPAIAAGQPFQPWRLAALEDQPHHLYIAHPTLLALAGRSELNIGVELSQGSSEPLDSTWEYWDGEAWRPFLNSVTNCDGESTAEQTGTSRFRRSGALRLLTEAAKTEPIEIDGTKSFWVRGRLTEPLLPDPASLLPEVEQISLTTAVTRPIGTTPVGAGTPTGLSDGLLPDVVLVDGVEADLTKPFYPFGMQPQPGAAFYLSSAEAFGKPGAELRLSYVRTATPQDDLTGTTTLAHVVEWEYWNSAEWVAMPGLPRNSTRNPADLDPPVSTPVGNVLFTVPEDMAETTVADREARWLRARLVSGGFGVKETVTWAGIGQTNSFTYVVSRPPALSAVRLGYTWRSGPVAPERVLAYNDFQFTDRTTEAVWPGAVFRPFTPPADTTPALYLGFDKPLPVDELGLLIDVVEDPADPLGPAQVWESWDGNSWRRLSVADETNRMRLPGLVRLIGPARSRPLSRFGSPLHWLRARLAEDGPPGAPVINGLHLNATWAAQQETVVGESLGAATGTPGLVLAFPRFPVLPGERIEVREFAGPRAAAEWRVVVHELFPGDPGVIGDLEAQLGREGVADVERAPVRLRRDRNKRITEVWVTWQGRDDLRDSAPADRHYALERARGRLAFGDGVHGRIPAPGAAVVARRYQTGGGSAGNVVAGAITQMQAAISGVRSVVNPKPAEGGADTETTAGLRGRGPGAVRHRGRGLSASDLETMAREASPAVAVARVLPARAGDGRRAPGHITVVITPDVADPQPWPTFALRETVRGYLEQRTAATIAGLRRIDVIGPRYQPVDVDATLVVRPGRAAGELVDAAGAALRRLLHPLTGGPDGTGWPPGRSVFLSDVAAVLTGLPGLDHVEGLAVSVAARISGEMVTVPADHSVVAGDLRLEVTGS
jgi:hypothetical protein